MLEDLIESVGSSGKFQWITVLLIMSSKLVIGMSMLIMVYGSLVPDWSCVPNNVSNDVVGIMNTSNPYYQFCSNETAHCSSRVYESYTRTVVSEFDLVCENAWIKPSVTSIQMAGVLVGGVVGGQCGDMFGRKNTIYLSMLLHGVTNIVVAFSVNWQMFAALRFFIGISIGTYLVLVVYPLEFIGIKRRALASSLPFWTFGVILLSLLSYLIHDWMQLHILIGALTFPYLLGWFIVPESLRWLATKNRIEEALLVLEKMARYNGTTVPDNAKSVLRKVAEVEQEQNQGQKKYTYLDIYRTLPMFKKSIRIQFLWFSCSAIYYGFSFGVSNFSGNFYLNFFLMNVIELTAFFPVVYLLGKIGRRYTCAGGLCLAAAACVAALVVQEVNDVQKSALITGVSLTAKIFTGAAWVALILLSNETYPTVIRYLGYGAANTMARIGGIIAPFIFNLGTNRMTPYIIMIVLMVISAVCALSLTETKDSALPDLVDNSTVTKKQDKPMVYQISRDLESNVDISQLTEKPKLNGITMEAVGNTENTITRL